MIAAPTGNSQLRHAEAGAPLSLLHDIPRDVIPNVFERLPGPDLLRLAQVSKQIPMDNKQALLTEWASRELQDIGTLAGEQLWTRFFALTRNCADIIDSGDWENFLATVESQHPGHAVLLGLALLAPGKTRHSDSLEMLTALPASEFGMPASGALMALVESADKEPWMGKVAGAVIAGRWHQEVEQGKNTGDAPGHRLFDGIAVLALLCSQLPLAHQIEVLPLLECRNNDDGRSTKVYAELSKRHMLKVGRHVFNNSPDFIFANASPSYFACLARMYKPEFSDDKMAYTRSVMKQIFSHSLEKGMKIGPWRKQMPELVSCLLLALHWNSKGCIGGEELKNQLVDRQFMTEHEYTEFSSYVAKAKGSDFDKVQQGLGLSRGKSAQAQPDSSCTMS